MNVSNFVPITSLVRSWPGSVVSTGASTGFLEKVGVADVTSTTSSGGTTVTLSLYVQTSSGDLLENGGFELAALPGWVAYVGPPTSGAPKTFDVSYTVDAAGRRVGGIR